MTRDEWKAYERVRYNDVDITALNDSADHPTVIKAFDCAITKASS